MSDPIRGRLNAWFFDMLDATLHEQMGAAKEALFADLPETVLELGSGAGANLRCLRRGTKLIAIEPNAFMHPRLVRNAASRGIDLRIHPTTAERIDLPDASVDAVISSLVLCSVADVDQSLSEVRRVLRPGGKFACIEHVAAPAGTAVGRIQRLVFRPWRWLFEGCHTHRELDRAIERAGFARVAIERVHVDTPFVPVCPQIHVEAFR